MWATCIHPDDHKAFFNSLSIELFRAPGHKSEFTKIYKVHCHFVFCLVFFIHERRYVVPRPFGLVSPVRVGGNGVLFPTRSIQKPSARLIPGRFCFVVPEASCGSRLPPPQPTDRPTTDQLSTLLFVLYLVSSLLRANSVESARAGRSLR